MNIVQKIILYNLLFCLLVTSIHTKQKPNDYTEKLKNAVTSHEPLKIDYKNIINPTEIGLSNPKELENKPTRLTHEQKVEKYETDKEIRNIFHRHAQGLVEGKIFTSKQGLNFYNMDIHEQKAQMQKWLNDHNVHQINELKKASNDYRQKLKNFKGNAQHDTLKTVVKLENQIKSRNDEIKILNKKLK
ncbi:hypothetical protein KBB68_02415 [Candidatus Babeliales bacterium]|nr:hypothetical protein [Candidatus Babeliales bacterium]